MFARFWSSPRKRVALLLALSLLLHLLVLDWPGWPTPAPVVDTGRIEAVLVSPPKAETPEPKPLSPVPPAPARDTARPHAHKASPAPRSAPVLATPDAPSALSPQDSPLPGPAEVAEGAGPANPAAGGGAGAAATPSDPVPVEAAPPDGTPPEAAVLYYDVVGKDPKKDPNQSYIGNGRITWRLDGANGYQADLNATASLLFLRFTVLESHSEGLIDKSGLEPNRYTETPRNRGALVTLFRRGQESVGVGSGAISDVARGTQDRLSIIFQLGALLRANPAFSQPGAQFEVRVANLKGETSIWTFRVFGEEPVTIDMGRIDAIHVQRILKPGTNDRRVDVWVALDLGGYPARILYTEPSDAFVDLKLTRIE